MLAARLEGEGAEVVAYDPVAGEGARGLLDKVEFRDSPLEALDGVDAAVLVTEWPEFAELDWAAAAARMAGRCWSTVATSSTRRYSRPPALPTRASARAVEKASVPRGHDGVVQAIVLVGGEGTRLRPLTETCRSRR